ncbi:MAG: hypothetical protein ACFCD0_17390 [Gemmataceae bacterium]
MHTIPRITQQRTALASAYQHPPELVIPRSSGFWTVPAPKTSRSRNLALKHTWNEAHRLNGDFVRSLFSRALNWG